MPGKGWFTILRLYGALEPWFDKSWRPGEIELTIRGQTIRGRRSGIQTDDPGTGSCEEIDGDGPDKELLLTGGCG